MLSNLLVDTWTVTNQYIEPTHAIASEIALEAPELAQVKRLTCVQYVRTKIPSLPKGDAYSLIPNSLYPIKGGVLKMSYQIGNNFDPNRYHLAYVEKVTSEGIYVSEANFNGNEYNERLVDFNDDHIRGYWSPNPER